MTAPRWEDSGQGDLLELVALGSSTGSADDEWDYFVECLYDCAAWGPTPGLINPNVLRQQVRDHVAPRRIGAFTSRALARGLIAYTGEWLTSTDTAGRNSGKPCRVMRWTGGAL